MFLLQLSILIESSDHKWSGLDVAGRLVSLLPDHIYPSGGFSSNTLNWVKPVQESDKSLDPSIFQKSSMRRSCLTSKFVVVVLDTSMFSVESGVILLSASKVWLWVQRDGGMWSFLTWTKSHLSLHRHPEMSLEVVEEKTLLILQESQYYSFLELVDALPRWMFSVPDLLQGFLFVHLRLEKWSFHFLGEISSPLHWVF